MSNKRIYSICTILFLFILFLILSTDFEEDNHQLTITPVRNTSKRNYKLIVLWTVYSASKTWGNPHIADADFFNKTNCPETRCRIVLPEQKYKYPSTEYDVVLINGYNLQYGYPVPEKRLPHQIYVFLSREPPHPWWLQSVNFDEPYNLTCM